MLSSISQSIIDYFLADPLMNTVQVFIIFIAVLEIFLLFFALRDILLRTKSFWYQCGSILLVALVPGLGFLLYLLIRPARTLKDRELESLLRSSLQPHANS